MYYFPNEYIWLKFILLQQRLKSWSILHNFNIFGMDLINIIFLSAQLIIFQYSLLKSLSDTKLLWVCVCWLFCFKIGYTLDQCFKFSSVIHSIYIVQIDFLSLLYFSCLMRLSQLLGNLYFLFPVTGIWYMNTWIFPFCIFFCFL